ncbi:DUF5996 family protein [Thalassococcus sp. S3]|uniref:DUF5996 family protein n=1 Tax=Thalassococcus sp. S3 TaxID=2017482 RepID=UPI0010241254|nr:DUF5996 family protein [Thalassococcus sp. S3]QBF32523.1 hypothetical protein CFI11_15045 [Thalassococcus sp. S3]
MSENALPQLPYSAWVDSKESLHLFLQIIGKVRLKTHPKLNHWWHVTLYVAARGLTTGRIPHPSGGFQIDYDMLEHRVEISRNDGRTVAFPVAGKSIAAFYEALFGGLQSLGIAVQINTMPYDNKSKIRFPEDTQDRAYDTAAVSNYWRALCSIASVFEVYRGQFVGKQTPVHLYWHSFDLVVTRFSGRAAPLENARTQSDREAYSHEVISVGFWPGDDTFPHPAFYGYAYPEPKGLSRHALRPREAVWNDKNGGALAILKYDDMRRSPDPGAALLSFLNSVYAAGAEASGWQVDEYHHQYLDT